MTWICIKHINSIHEIVPHSQHETPQRHIQPKLYHSRSRRSWVVMKRKKEMEKKKAKKTTISLSFEYRSRLPRRCCAAANSDFDENMWRKAKKIAAIAGRLLRGSVLLSLVWFEAAAACCLCRVCISKTQALQQPRSEVISAVIVSATNYSVALALHIHTHSSAPRRDSSQALSREWKI